MQMLYRVQHTSCHWRFVVSEDEAHHNVAPIACMPRFFCSSFQLLLCPYQHCCALIPHVLTRFITMSVTCDRGDGSSRQVNRLPHGGVGVRGESCMHCSILHPTVATAVQTHRVRVPVLAILGESPKLCSQRAYKLHPAEQQVGPAPP